MRHLSHFTPREWARLVPLKHALKQVRNDAWLEAYLLARARGQEAFLRHARGDNARNLVLVTAFEKPLVLDLQLTMARRHLVDATLYVFDNSIHESARRAISEVCNRHDVAYLGLPRHGSRHANRSHGMALNWIYRNVVRQLKPEIFAFIDHDLIPLQPISLHQRLDNQPFFGMPVHSPWAWQLWAGYCLFDYHAVSSRKLNFNYDFSQGLDTGGRNWRPLYRSFHQHAAYFADSRRVRLHSPGHRQPVTVQLVDGDRWLHLEGAGYGAHMDPEGNRWAAVSNAFVGGLRWSEITQLLEPRGEPA